MNKFKYFSFALLVGASLSAEAMHGEDAEHVNPSTQAALSSSSMDSEDSEGDFMASVISAQRWNFVPKVPTQPSGATVQNSKATIPEADKKEHVNPSAQAALSSSSMDSEDSEGDFVASVISAQRWNFVPKVPAQPSGATVQNSKAKIPEADKKEHVNPSTQAELSSSSMDSEDSEGELMFAPIVSAYHFTSTPKVPAQPSGYNFPHIRDESDTLSQASKRRKKDEQESEQ